MYLSFIVIGKNEEHNLERCIQSIYNVASSLAYDQYEIIYVDSKSHDQSIDLIKNKFTKVTTLELVGETNAAIARNAGAKVARGEYLMFIDADMEISKEFFKLNLDLNGKFTHSFFSGQVRDIYTNNEFSLRYSKAIKGDYLSSIAGGIFVIQKKYFDGVLGFNTKFSCGEEPDLSLRIAKKYKIRFLRKNLIICNHYTEKIPSIHKIYTRISNLSNYQARSVLLREHIFNIYSYPELLTRNIFSLVLFLTLILAIIFTKFEIFIPYFIIRISYLLITRTDNFMISILGNFTTDILNILTFFFYYPKRKSVLYKQI